MTILSPGVYIQEVESGPRPIQAVGTSTAGFIGVSPNAKAPENKAIAINNWQHFIREFVGESTESTTLAIAVFGFFQNGGRRCYVVNVGKNGRVSSSGKEPKGVAVLEAFDDIAIVAAPGFTDVDDYEALLSHCERLKDRVAILDGPESTNDVEQLTRIKTPAGDDASDSPGLRCRQSKGGFGAIYFPWVKVKDPLSSSNELVSLPPSGHLAGLYARNDATRGVHNAPANYVLSGVLDLCQRITPAEQDVLNPVGVNCIRMFSGSGIRVWGARTVADGSSEWRYLNVRRLFCMIEESILKSMNWVVFEPNDITLWKKIKRDLSAFLMGLWREGALMGARPEDAFFVQCDSETNSQGEIDQGRVVTFIGIAPVKPAEFIIFKVGQYAGGAEVETQGEN